MKRYLDCRASDLEKITKEELLKSFQLSEGRILVSETIGTTEPLLGNVSNAEFAASQGADVVLLNIFDVDTPIIKGIPHCELDDVVRMVKKLTGRVVGINLEPVDEYFDVLSSENFHMSSGRYATVENAIKAADMGVNIIVLTGNPGNGVTNQAITASISQVKAAVGERVIVVAGKMHAAGILAESAESIVSKEDVVAFAKAGADIILLPAPGTVPGISEGYIRELVGVAHKEGKMTMTAIGTSQEGADEQTIRSIALMAKMTGTDLHHIGDSGYVGMAMPENIFAYSVTIKGKRHTYTRMAASLRR